MDEPGSEDFERLLEKASEIAVSPTTWIEMNGIIERRVREKLLNLEKAAWLRAAIKKDFTYFFVVVWNENLEDKAVELVHQHSLKTMDVVQLASAVLSESGLFLTSDRKLYQEAKKIVKHAQFI